MLKALLLISAISATAASAQHSTLPLMELDKAEAQWNTAQLTNYSYTLVRGDPPYGHTTFSIRVRGADCRALSSVTLFGRTQRWKEDTCAGHTMVELFDRIRDQLTRGVTTWRMEFDEKYGYLRSLDLEPYPPGEHSEWTVEVKYFRTRNAGNK